MFSNYMMAAVALVALAALGQTKPPKGEWPLPGHDNRHLAQAELPCDMASAPQEVWSYDIGSVPAGAALCADVDGDGEDEVIYGASPLVCKKLSGEELWRSGLGRVIAIADIDGDGRAELLTDSAVVVDGRTGGVLWSRTGPGGVAGRLQVAKLLPDVKGLQIATVSTDYGTMSKHAQVWSFANGFDAAELVWGRDFDTWEHSRIAVGAFDETRNCVISPTWGGFSAMDARDGTELMRLYWEGAPGISGLRQYTDQVITDLDGDGRSEYVVMATNIAQHLDMVALWRGSPGEHADKAKPVPAPDVPRTELAAYADGPLVWQRYFGTNYPTEDYLLRIPPTPIADVDGDGTQEVICTVGGQRWELKVYDGMTGAEKLSLPDAEAEAVFDLDGDGMPEIVARESGELVIGNLREGAWVERLRLPQCHMAYTERPIDPQLRAGPYSMEHRPVSVEVDGEPAWVGWKDTDGNGRADALVLLRATADGGLEVEERALPDDRYVSVLAGSGDRLIAVSADGQMHVLDPGLESTASWPCGTTFISEPVVADIDDDGVNEVLVYRAEQKAVALRAPADGESEPREVWSVDAGEPPTGMWHNTGGGLQTPLCADVNGDGKHEILITCRTAGGDQGARLLNWRGETIWETDIPFSTATFGDFNGDGHLDVYGAALTASERSVGKNGQSFALNGRDGSGLWHNDGSAEVVWHHHVGPSDRRATVFDVNGDGCDDVIFTALDLCGVL
ncbi:MAG TPA: hypothetical protein QGH10_17135, partial [Armatimonadota bacterium]|nr:hypothetical protein [Armatimonadota bacterium]